MKHFSTIFIITILSLTLAWGQQPDYKNSRKHSIRSQNTSSRQVTGTMTSTNFYISGATMDLTFTLELTNTDDEYGDLLSMTFPAPLTPNSSPDDPFPSPLTGGQGAEALNGVIGQVISWGDDDNNYGGIEPGNIIPFAVNVTIPPGTTGPQTISFFVSGDEFGTSPGPLTGTVMVTEAPNIPIGRLSLDNLSSLTAIGTPEVSGNFTLANIGAATLQVMSTNMTGTEFSTSFNADSVSGTSNYNFTFTYTPTDVADDVDTFSIMTNDGNLDIFLYGYAHGNGVTLEDFEDTTTFPTCQWIINDVDGDGFNWGPYPFSPHSGLQCAASNSFVNGVGALTPDNYLITPQLSPVAGKDFISYWVAAQQAGFPAENYSVSVSTTGTDPSDFTIVIFTEILSSIEWKEVNLDLSAYNGMNIYVAFRHFNVTDEFLMKIDDIRIPPLTDPNPVLNPITLSLTVTDEFCQGDSLGSVTANVTGGAPYLTYVWSDGSVTPNLPMVGAGTYVLTVSDNCGSAPATQTAMVGFTNPMEDPTFNYDALIFCNNGSNPTATVSGTAGGTFSGPSGLVFVSTTTGEIDLASSTIGGPYQVTYTTPGPCFQSAFTGILIQDCTPIEDLNTQGISMYPNPSEGLFVIKNEGEARTATLEIIDMNGRSVLKESLFLPREGKHEVDLSGNPAGVYLVKVASDDKVGVDRIFIR